jgi:hypothetical protein
MSEKTMYEYRSKLSVFEDESSILVKGDTFRYGFDKKSGLMSCLEVLGDDFLSGTDSQVPDIYVSSARDPRETSYAAKYEDEAECDVISANPYEVHIRTHGLYHNASGETFPVRYRITYEIQSDGTIFVIVHNKAYEACVIRWLCISRGILRPSLCKYFSYLVDQSKVDTTDNYIFKELPSEKAEEQKLFSGRLIPWFWLGNDSSGIEICVWDVTHHRYGATQIAGEMVDPLGDVGDNISCFRQSSESDGSILWEIFSLRNLQTPVKAGWEQINYFSLSVTPPKRRNPELADLRVYWEGPHRYSDSYRYPTDDEIRSLSSMGYNLVIGGVNWRPGEYLSDKESEVKRVISTCHKHGMKIIPCVHLMDLSEDTSVFEDHGPEWRIEPVIEYEYETHIMCPGAEEWREHWNQQIDRIIQDYDFDGVYLDLWYDKLACRNAQHGCQRRYMRPTFPWVREMLGYAGAKLKSKTPDSMIVANTDMLPISMICNWLDIRAVGASQDICQVDVMTRNAFYNSHRLGCNGLFWSDPKQKVDPHLISLSLLYMSPIILSRKRSREEIDLTLLYWNVFRHFGVGEAEWYPGFVYDSETKVASASNPDLYINVHKRDGLLLTLINISPDGARASISLMDLKELGLQSDKEYLIYDPVSRRFLGDGRQWSYDDLKDISVMVPGHSPQLLYVFGCVERPILLFALGSDRAMEEHWDDDTGILQFQLNAPVGANISLAIYCPAGKPTNIIWEGKEAKFNWDEDQKLALFETQVSCVTAVVSVTVMIC